MNGTKLNPTSTLDRQRERRGIRQGRGGSPCSSFCQRQQLNKLQRGVPETQEQHRTEPRISIRKRRSSHRNVGTSQHRVRSAAAEFSDQTTEEELRVRRRPEHIRILPADSGNRKSRHFTTVQRHLAEMSAEVLETCNRHTDIEDWKGPASCIVIPTDIADVNTQQTDGETGDKSANVVPREVRPAVEHTVRFSKRQKHRLSYHPTP